MTKSCESFDRAVMMSSEMPSAKYSWLGSSLMLVNGSTAIDGLSGRAGDYAAEAVDPQKRAELFKTCDEALRLDPHNVIALGVRAVWLLDGMDQAQSADREGDLKRAKEDVTTLLAINKSDAYANALNVYLLRLEGQPEQAVAEGEKRRRWIGCAAVSLCRRRARSRCVTRLRSSRSWGATTKLGKPTGARRVAGLRPDNH